MKVWHFDKTFDCFLFIFFLLRVWYYFTLVSRNHNGRRLILSQFVHGYNYTRIWYIISKVHGSRVLYKYVARSFAIADEFLYITRTHLCTHSSHAHSKNPLALIFPPLAQIFHLTTITFLFFLFSLFSICDYENNLLEIIIGSLALVLKFVYGLIFVMFDTFVSRLYKRDASIHVYVRV